MDEKAIRLLIENGAIKQIKIIGNGGRLHVEAITPTGKQIATTLKGKLKTWSMIDAAADAAEKRAHKLGIGTLQLEIGKWHPGQKGLKL